MRQPDLFPVISECGALRFDGQTVAPDDVPRLSSQLLAVKTLMLDGRARTLKEIAHATGASEAGASARLRDLRKSRFGGYVVERTRLDGGLFMYQVVR